MPKDAGIYFSSGTQLLEGGEVALAAAAGRDRLHLTVNGEEGIVGSASYSNSNERAVGDDGEAEGGVLDGRIGNSGGPFMVGEMDLARLNDSLFHRAYATAVAEVLLAQGLETGVSTSPSKRPPVLLASAGARPTPTPRKSAATPVSSTSLSAAPSAPPSPACVLDLCGAWGLAGLLVAQLEGRDGTPATRVLALAEDEEAAAALNALARENGLGPDRYVAAEGGLVDLVSNGGIFGGPSSAGLNVSDNSDCLNSWGRAHNAPDARSVVMTTSLVEGSGLLKQGVLGDLELCRRLFCADSDSVAEKSAATSTTFVPGSLEVVCRGLQRAALLLENCVQSDSCCGVDVSAVNSFGVENFRELDLSAAAPSGYGAEKRDSSSSSVNNDDDDDKQQVSPPSPETFVECGPDDEAFLTAPVVCYDVDLANVRAGPDGCLKRRCTRLRVERNGTLHALSYWYRQHLRPTDSGEDAAVIDTGPCMAAAGANDDEQSSRSHARVPSQGRFSHFRQAAVLLSKPAAVTVGQYIDLSVFCNTSQGVVIQVLGISEEVAGQGLA